MHVQCIYSNCCGHVHILYHRKSGGSSLLDKSSSRRSYSESVKSAESVSTEDITDKIPDNDDDDDDINALLKDNDISWVSLHKKSIHRQKI